MATQQKPEWVAKTKAAIAASEFVNTYDGARVNKEVRDSLASIIGEGVHTGLRKFSDSSQSADAWRAIKDMPEKDWSYIVDITAEVVLRYLSYDAELLVPGIVKEQ